MDAGVGEAYVEVATRRPAASYRLEETIVAPKPGVVSSTVRPSGSALVMRQRGESGPRRPSEVFVHSHPSASVP